MTVEELIIEGKKYLHSTQVKMLLANLLGVNPLELLNYLNQVVAVDIVEKYRNQIQSLVKKEPIQYVIGNVNFYGNIFQVSKDTLIPRFETEELVEKTLEYIHDLFLNQPLKIIDLGTGTGCIGLTLKKQLPESEVTLIDIDPNTLEVAKTNARNLETAANFIISDFWNQVEGKFNIIVSNPPYIKTTEEIDLLVKEHEPHLALYAGEEGLDCYNKIFSQIKDHLEEHYLIALEIGCNQRKDVVSLIKEILPEATILCHKDLQGRDRIIIAYC